VAPIGESKRKGSKVEKLTVPDKGLVGLGLAIARDLVDLVNFIWSAEPFQRAF
jgi:hypothetical protein